MPSHVAFLRAVNVGGRFVTMAAATLGELAGGPRRARWYKTTLTNARLERVTGRTTTWRDLEVVRAVDERWGT